MTNSTQNPIAAASSEHETRTLYPHDGSAERQGVDREAGLEYFPMDVFVDPKTMRRHFRARRFAPSGSESTRSSVEMPGLPPRIAFRPAPNRLPFGRRCSTSHTQR